MDHGGHRGHGGTIRWEFDLRVLRVLRGGALSRLRGEELLWMVD
jgi:hypothetical protein